MGRVHFCCKVPVLITEVGDTEHPSVFTSWPDRGMDWGQKAPTLLGQLLQPPAFHSPSFSSRTFCRFNDVQPLGAEPPVGNLRLYLPSTSLSGTQYVRTWTDSIGICFHRCMRDHDSPRLHPQNPPRRHYFVSPDVEMHPSGRKTRVEEMGVFSLCTKTSAQALALALLYYPPPKQCCAIIDVGKL
jgi:hypothetical protein